MWKASVYYMGKTILKWFVVCLIIVILPVLITYFMSGAPSVYAGEGSGKSDSLSADVTINGGLSLNEYIKGVLAATLPMDYEEDTYKMQAIIVRTLVCYAYSQSGNTENQVNMDTLQLDYINPGTLEDAYDEVTYKTYLEKLNNAVESTNHQILTFDNQPIQALFHSYNAGKTRSYEEVYGKKVEYLQSVVSEPDQTNQEVTQLTELEPEYVVAQLKSELGVTIEKEKLIEQLEIKSKDEEGYVKEIRVGTTTVTGEQFQSCFMLNSTNFTLELKEGKLDIICKGKGSGIGFSLYGANQMVQKGKTTEEILSYYYPNTTMIEKDL